MRKLECAFHPAVRCIYTYIDIDICSGSGGSLQLQIRFLCKASVLFLTFVRIESDLHFYNLDLDVQAGTGHVRDAVAAFLATELLMPKLLYPYPA